MKDPRVITLARRVVEAHLAKHRQMEQAVKNIRRDYAFYKHEADNGSKAAQDTLNALEKAEMFIRAHS